MKKVLSFIKNKMVLLGAVMVATIVGGATTAVVLAAIPDGDGVIHSCRLNLTGTVRIIDSASGSCNGLETALNWSQGGGGAALHDANGQLIGNLFDAPGANSDPWVVYNPTLNRVLMITYSGDADKYTIISPSNSVFFESSDCTGQAYTGADPLSGMKTNLIRVGSSAYGTVQDSASAQTKTINSMRQYDPAADSFTCNSADFTGSLYAISSASLPFSLPLANPFRF